jgi:hypothetical protein
MMSRFVMAWLGWDFKDSENQGNKFQIPNKLQIPGKFHAVSSAEGGRRKVIYL